MMPAIALLVKESLCWLIKVVTTKEKGKSWAASEY